MKIHLLSLMLFLGCGAAVSEEDAFKQQFQRQRMDKKYTLQASLNPAFLKADFNGDGFADQAASIIEKTTGKKGVLLLHGNSNRFFVFGAGVPFGENDDDYRWADQWKLYTDSIAYETHFDATTGDIIGGKEHKLRYPALLLEDLEDGAALAGGIIYWKGDGYGWLHQGE